MGVNLKIKMEKEEKIEKLADIIAPITPDLRYCDCIVIATKLIELNIIKEFDDIK